ncbi:2-dehydropantoate 2-reductase [Ideonella alba]|uniref:2-dehydropantoate 2-reductase n=1 Tax=Ideonella alba TaxID=2824118 RepID=A0A940YHD0_9BURK|nr:2-dehydropantoate 2-reductase [Ideonella alba]MBQ0929939.1 2-dehydropantoate 2-reductase [Ideonella alba]
MADDDNPVPPATVLVMGCGSVGAFLAARLQAAGAVVHCVGRGRMLDALRSHGLRATDIEAAPVELPAESLHLHERVPSGLLPDLTLLTVKCSGTADAARALAQRLPPGSPVLCLQNGIDQAGQARALAPRLDWLTGMVPFNVAELEPGHLHRGTTGRLAAQDAPVVQRLAPLFAHAGLPLARHADMRPVQWGKLLLNLNNPVNALSGLPLRAELMNRGYRRILAALQREALAALAAAGITPARMTPLPPHRLPALLEAPDWLFRLLARRMLRIDPQARSSMADDLAQGRRTEIDDLCGAVVRLGREHGVPTPLNERMLSLVGTWPPPGEWPSADGLRQALQAPGS